FFWVSLATSWNILSGYAGYFSFGHAAFFGAGVYTTATLATPLDVPFLWTLRAAGLMAALLGTAIAAVVFRVRGVRGELFGLLTLAVTFVLSTISLNTRIDGGPGVFLAAVAIPKLFGAPATTLYHLALVVALLSVAAALAIFRSRWGMGLFAIRDDEDVAEVLGVPTYRYKLVAFALSCFIAGLIGGIHAMFVSYVTVAETFSVGLADAAGATGRGDAAGLRGRAQGVSRSPGARRRDARGAGGRDPRPHRAERLGQVDPDQRGQRLLPGRWRAHRARRPRYRAGRRAPD